MAVVKHPTAPDFIFFCNCVNVEVVKQTHCTQAHFLVAIHTICNFLILCMCVVCVCVCVYSPLCFVRYALEEEGPNVPIFVNPEVSKNYSNDYGPGG